MLESFIVWISFRRYVCNSFEQLEELVERFPGIKARNDFDTYIKWYVNFQYIGSYSFNDIVKKKENK